jgi:hypothetical protein
MKRKIGRTMVIPFCICLLLSFLGCSAERAKNEDDTMGEIQSEYLVLKFPAEYMDYLNHEELTSSGRIVEHFYMVWQDASHELFRLYFGDETMGSPVGYLHTDDGVVPITIMVMESPENMDEETENLYYGMMKCINTVLESVYADKRYSEYSSFHAGDYVEVTMQYWSVTLPANIVCEEMTEGDVYCANFYGKVAGTRILLYTIKLSNEKVTPALGTMEIDGQIKTVSVSVEGMAQISTLSETDQDIAYSMMDTINDVIEQIVASEFFAAPSEE